MKIAVCVSHVPDTATKISLQDDAMGISSAGVSYVINPYDEFAVEEALKVKEKTEAEVIVISVGTDAVKDTIRKALAMGADSGMLLKTGSNLDSVAVSKLLAEEIKTLECNLVFMGKQSIDSDNGVVGQMVSELLGFHSVSTAVTFELNGETIVAEREIEGGKEVVETTLPAVITAQKGLNEPRYASLKGIMKAKKKKIEEKDVAVEQITTKMHGLELPPEKSSGKILGEDASAVAELVKVMKEDLKVI